MAGNPVGLTAIETSLVELLLRRAPNVLTRRLIATQVWEDEADAVGSNTIDVHMGRVRSKLAASRAQHRDRAGHGLPDGREVNGDPGAPSACGAGGGRGDPDRDGGLRASLPWSST